MPRYIGLGRTLAFANQGETIDAEQALALGLISGIIDDGQDLAQVCVEYIQTLSGHHREVLQSNRRSILPSAEEISTALDKYYDSMGTVIARSASPGAILIVFADVTLQAWLATGVVLMPVLSAVILFARREFSAHAGLVAAAASELSLALIVYLLLAQVQGVYVLWEWAPDLDAILSWRLNQGTLAIAALVAFIGVLVMHFAGAYFGSSQKGRRAIATLSLFQASMLGLILADNLFILFTFWELTGLCSFFLINTDADKRDDTFAAAQQALIVTVGGALPMLLGFIYLASVGSASLTELYALELPVAAQTIAFLLILPAVLTKSAQLPYARMFGIAEDEFANTTFKYVGAYKLLLTVFCFAPWLALTLMA